MKPLSTEEVRDSLQGVLELSLKTARDIQGVLDDLASRQPVPERAEHPEVTPDEGDLREKRKSLERRRGAS